MISIKKYYRFFANHKITCFISSKSFLLLLLVLLFSMGFEANAKSKKRKKKKNLELSFKLASHYDNNILKYSDKYLDRFMNGEDAGRFHIDTYDDMVLTAALQAKYTFKIFDGRKSIVSGELSRRTYVVNGIKSWNYMAIGFQQYITKKAFVKLSYSYIPYFYVRHFRDDDWVDVYGYVPETFQPYAFSKDNLGAYIQNTFFKNTRVRLSLYHAKYYHNEHYTEYDSKDFLYGFNIFQPVNKKLRIDAGYQYVTSDAKGYNSAYETPETSNGPDATFVEDRFTAGLLWYMPKIKNHRNNLDVDFGLLLRYYSSGYSPIVDPLHAGRVDQNYRFSMVYNFHWNKSLKISAYYKFFMRDSETKAPINKQYVSNEKDYTQYHLGLQVVYKIKM
jgi:hypothetical protein